MTDAEDRPARHHQTLPPEIWNSVLGFLIRQNGRKSIHLEDLFEPPYATESLEVVDPDMRQDRRTVTLVCRQWNALASQIIPEYLIIRSIPQLRAILSRLEETPSDGSPRVGIWVQRVDFEIKEPLSSPATLDLIPRLLRRTPNLMIYVNKNGSDYAPETQTPSAVLEALAKYCGSSLRRIEWSHVGEAPTWLDLANLLLRTPNLVTLRLTWIFSYDNPGHVDVALELPSLQTLYLGLIPDPSEALIALPLSWDPLLDYLAARPGMLPALQRFEIEIFPSRHGFFRVHGHKIKTFRTTNWNFPPTLPMTLPLMPNLDNLILTQSSEYVMLPKSHPSLRRICISPFEDKPSAVPPRIFQRAVLLPLDHVLLSIDTTKLPRLEQVRVRNIGMLATLVDEPAWLLKWAQRWKFRGVAFCDVNGQPYSLVRDPDNDPLLNAVRG
ncbi:unnamed protein product [Mycena citricolor]|uniref:F-box domain-containing protein n=1 Tax=Mycena citricolor TaxID=2018698 RepID=A0AAD2GQ43_9AGAR|nr:unnamed protein product [Mycena citricolor]